MSEAARACELERPVIFGGLDWDSAAFHNEVARIILEEGYGCKTDVIPGSSIPLITGLTRGDIDILMEVWVDNVIEPWKKGLERGDVVDLGTNFPDAVQGWYVPRYLVEGDAERGLAPAAPGLRHVHDLPRYKDLFRDPEFPSKGRFYNCIAGWVCEIHNTAKLKAYGLDASFTNFRPGTGAALAAAITAAYQKGEPVLAYYWGPTWVLGIHNLIKLEEPPYDKAKWDAFVQDPFTYPPTAFPVVEVIVGANSAFSRSAPRITAFLRAYETNSRIVSQSLAFLQQNSGTSPRDAARDFLRQHRDVWTAWVPAEVAARIGGTQIQKEPPFPVVLSFPLGEWINQGVESLVRDHSDGFEVVSDIILRVIITVERGLRALPWWLVLTVVALTGLHATRNAATSLFFIGAFFLVGMLDLWELTIQTLALMLVSVGAALLLGLPTGILLSRGKKRRRLILPVLDAMQTLPSFVYLVPALMLFGLGKVPAVFATVIYATPPLIRLTDLGIRLVDQNIREAAADLGAKPFRRLLDIDLPLALPNIMAGINQTIMMALSMVVIASMIGARGLGEQVLLGIQRLDVGQGLIAGLAIVALAVIFDRITQAYGRPELRYQKPFALRKVRTFLSIYLSR